MKEKIRTWVGTRQEACQSSPLIRLLATAEGLSLLVAAVCYCLGFPGRNLSILMIGSFLIWLGSVFFCLQNLKSRMILLGFDLVVFLFVFSSILTDIVTGTVQWEKYGMDAAFTAVLASGISVFFLYIGGIVCEVFTRSPAQVPPSNACAPKGHHLETFRLVALLLYLFCLAFSFLQSAEMLLFMRGRQYEEYYYNFQSVLPGFVYTFSCVVPCALCIYLSTFPKKRSAFLCLLLYVLSNVPTLLIGMRNQFSLSIIFAFFYYCFRDAVGDREKWIGKNEKCLVLMGVPAMMVLMITTSYLRYGRKLIINPFVAIGRLIYSQGTMFLNICRGFDTMPQIRAMVEGPKCYTFGAIIDSVSRSRLGQLLFHTMPFPPGNNAVRALEGHSFGDIFSYIAVPTYLEGGGWGTSYLLETYYDFGWLGIAVFSLLLGFFLVWFLRGMRKNWLIKSILLMSLTQLFMLPRESSTGWLVFLTGVHFWFAVAACVLGSMIFQKLGIYAMLSGFQKRICQFFHRAKT